MKRPRADELKFGDTTKIEDLSREVQLLLNVIEPDPKYQPMFISDESLVGQCTRNSEKVTEKRLHAYFGDSFELDVYMTFPAFIHAIKQAIPNWPDNQSN